MALAAAMIALRPSSGAMPACAGLAAELERDGVLRRAPP